MFLKTIFRRAVAVWALLAFLPGAPLSIAATPHEAEILRWITSHGQHSHSDESVPARTSVVGDLDGDSRDDLAVLYTLRSRSAPRGERRYLAVFKRQHDGKREVLRYYAHVLVGGTGAAEVNRAAILNKTVVIEMLTHRAGDPVCCPTRPATRRYRLAPRGLTVVQVPVKSKAGL